MFGKMAWKTGILAAALALLTATAAISAKWTVTNDTDSDEGSLRDRISDASDDDTIVFDDDYTIVLTSGYLQVSKNLTIDGSGHTIVISGNNQYKVFNINAGTVVLRSLTIEKGNSPSGSGIDSFRCVTTIRDCTIRDNAATETLGGGIFSYQGLLYIYDSTISGNSALTSGGGIYTYGEYLFIYDSTINGNSANDYGGGMYCVDDYGITIENITVSGNSSDFGAIAINGSYNYDITNSTIFDNSADSLAGGIWASNGTIDLKNTILAGNTANSSPDNYYNGGSASIVSQGYNLSDTTEFTGTTGDLLGKDLDSEIRLGDLAGNGGPTETHALLPGSLAIGRGTDDGAPSEDQRGEGRVGIADIGAFEYQGDYPDNTPARAGADSSEAEDIGDVTFHANDGDEKLADLAVKSGTGPASFTVVRYDEGCEDSSVGFCWDASVTGTFTGDLTFYFGGLDLNGLVEADLQLYHWTGSTWENLGGTVDDGEHTITVAGLDQDDFSPFTLNASDPLLVELAAFSATYGEGGVALAWETASEIDNAGFHVWRSESRDGEYVRVTDAMVPAVGDELAGAAYFFQDASVSSTRYFYELEDIDYGGKSTRHGLTARRQKLDFGWNVLSGDDFAGLSPKAALASIDGKYGSVWHMGSEGWQMHSPDNPALGNLETFEPGGVYWIDAEAECELSLP